jgi:hypothetical protein
MSGATSVLGNDAIAYGDAPLMNIVNRNTGEKLL